MTNPPVGTVHTRKSFSEESKMFLRKEEQVCVQIASGIAQKTHIHTKIVCVCVCQHNPNGGMHSFIFLSSRVFFNIFECRVVHICMHPLRREITDERKQVKTHVVHCVMMYGITGFSQQFKFITQCQMGDICLAIWTVLCLYQHFALSLFHYFIALCPSMVRLELYPTYALCTEWLEYCPAAARCHKE